MGWCLSVGRQTSEKAKDGATAEADVVESVSDSLSVVVIDGIVVLFHVKERKL